MGADTTEDRHDDAGGTRVASGMDGVAGHAAPTPSADLVDVRGPRFGAMLTTAVLVAALALQGPIGTALLAWQVVVFALAAIGGLSWSPYGALFRLIRRRLDLGPPPATEPAAAPRFAQTCGFAVGGAGLVALLLGATTLGWALAAVVLALSTLLATTGLCVGCELYLLGARLRSSVGRG